jgi:stage III sporulation protein AB
MIKALGSVLLIGGAALIGIFASGEIAVRSRSLDGFLKALEIMRAEIGESLVPVSELMEKLSKQTPSPVCDFFAECAREKRENPESAFFLIWSKALSRADYLRLSANEKDVIEELGAFLGRYSLDAQLKAIEKSARRLGSLALVAANDKKRLGKLYAKLGVIGGMAVTIILI